MWDRCSQEVLVATIGGKDLQTQVREFGTVTSSLTELKEWLLANNVSHVAMESTGAYWEPVYYVLNDNSLITNLVLNISTNGWEINVQIPEIRT